jgi:hypothetical protein
VPTWRAECFNRANGQTPQRSVIISAESEAVAFEEARVGMATTCSRVEVTKVEPDANTENPEPLRTQRKSTAQGDVPADGTIAGRAPAPVPRHSPSASPGAEVDRARAEDRGKAG